MLRKCCNYTAIISGILLTAVLAVRPALAAVGIDANVPKDQNTATTTVATPAFSTKSGNELLLAFVATDYLAGANTQVNSVTGANLTWVRVIRTNTQSGTAEVWRTFSPAILTNVTVTATLSQQVVSSMTVLSFTGVDTSGTSGSGAVGATGTGNGSSGAPTASLVTTRNGSWTFGVGNDFDNPILRTPAAGQTIVHQATPPVGDTYWVQMQNAPTPLSGTTVRINDTAPTGDRYNLSIVEVLPATGGGGSTLSISGTISPATSGAGALVVLSGPSAAAVTADSGGNYTFTNLASGTYSVTPSKTGFTFSPSSRTVSLSANVTGLNFTATAVPTWSISGSVTPSTSGSGTLLTLSGTPSLTTTANTSGNYSFSGLQNGGYTITPSKTGFAFTPPSQTVSVNGANVTGANFAAQAASSILYPDLKDIIPSSAISVVQTPTGKMFQYTHDTFNGGPGPLVIQPAYNPASGTYRGTQYLYTHTGNNWTISQTVPIAGAFLFDAQHGHFHFPFVTYGLYTVAANGSPGAPIASSGKVSFCINDSFLYDPSLPNAGAIGNLGPCSDPTSLRGLNIGAVDEYDQTDEGQSIVIDGVPDGTYWLRAIVDPDNYLAEADKTNNETDVKLTITGYTVQVLQTVTPVLPAPPNITLMAPLDGATVSGSVQITASTATTTGVQFLVDGQPLGGVVTTSPYRTNWNTTTVPNGTHWLAAQTTGPGGRIGTSPVATVTVTNTSTNPPTVQLTNPTAGSTVSAVVTMAATVASSVSIASVTFLVDNVGVGSPVTTPPYLISWDTETASAGQHTLTASAVDSTGNVGTSPPVTVTVDNSHPANVIREDAIVAMDGAGTITTPAFSTTGNNELLVAFVAYDGPSNSAQTATVSGAGLTWRLVKRSNTQGGTAEIWFTGAPNPVSNVTVISQPGVGGSSYHGSMTVIAFINASGVGIVGQASAPSGAPDIFLPGVSAGNWVFAVGNDWDRAVARTAATGQVLVHQKVDTQVGDTYWVQSTTAPSAANALVDIHDSAPTNDQWNYAAVEIVATRQ